MNSILNLLNYLNPSNLTKMSSKMNSKMAGINDLPIEIYELIFKDYLSITDLFSCRLVNKKFKFATYRSVQKLMIENNEFVIGELDKVKNEFWFHNNELINDDHVISLKCFKEIRSRSIFNLDQSLKYLKINFNKYNYLYYNYNEFEEYLNLNNLINLECLEINCKVGLEFDVNLKNLKYFKLNTYNWNNWKLNTPKLMKIQINKRSEIIFKSNPESIKHLITADYKDELKQFKNLEIIEFTDLSNLDENLLSFFNNLRQLKMNGLYSSMNFYLKNLVIKILNKRNELNRDIDIYLVGIKIMNEDKLREYQLSKNIFEFQLNNCDQLDSNITKISYLEYSKLNDRYNNLRNDLPSSFFDKFQNVSYIYVYNSYFRPIDADNLNWFLNNLKSLKILRIYNVLLDQNFFNNLPNTITSLFIRDDESLDLNVNLNFILKLTKLNKFVYCGFKQRWNTDLFDLALTSFINLKYLKEFEFDHKNKSIKIKKEKKSIFTFRINYSKSDDKLDYNQLIKKCNEFRSE